MTYVGIDPGKSGAIAVLFDDGEPPAIQKLDATPQDLIDFLRGYDTVNMRAMLELVHAMPKQGVTSTFTFGQNYGLLKGILAALQISYRLVTPQVWQRVLGCRSGGVKNRTKAAAQQIWPRAKITHATADAMLIAEYCRRTWR